MSRFSEAEAKAAGWVIVHQRDEYEVTVGPGLVQKHDATIVAEKYVSRPNEVGQLIHEEAPSMGLLLERIHAWEQHQKNVIPEVESFPVDESNEPRVFSPLYDIAEGEGEVARSVVVPTEPGDLTLEAGSRTISDAEWSARSRADVLVTDEGQKHLGGGTENVLDAEDARLENKKAIEDRRAAEPAHGPAKQVDFDTAGIVDTPGIGAGGVIVLRADEELGDIASRKEDLKKMREEGRVASMNEQGEAIAPDGADKLAGVDVGIQERGDLGSEVPGVGAVARTLEEDEDAEHPAPHLYPEGEPIVSEPPEEPASAVEADARADAEEEAALEQRDEGLVEAESDEAKNEVREAGIEAAEEAGEEFKDDPDPNAEAEQDERPAEGSEELEQAEAAEAEVAATPAAEELAKEKGVDLSQVEGSGKDGKVTKPDVEAAAAENGE